MAVTDEAAAETEVARAAIELIDAGAVLIDVRRPYEYEGGRLAGSRNIEMNELSAAADSIPARPAGAVLLPQRPLRHGGAGLPRGRLRRVQPRRGNRGVGGRGATARARRGRGAQAAAGIVGSARGGLGT